MPTTTLNAIRAHRPCADGWAKLLRHLGKTAADDEPLDLLTILDSNGLDDALWCLRAMPEHNRHWRLYAVWCARQVQHLMDDARSRAALDVAERHANGAASDQELDAALDAARDAAWTAVGAAAGDTARDAQARRLHEVCAQIDALGAGDAMKTEREVHAALTEQVKAKAVLVAKLAEHRNRQAAFGGARSVLPHCCSNCEQGRLPCKTPQACGIADPGEQFQSADREVFRLLVRVVVGAIALLGAAHVAARMGWLL